MSAPRKTSYIADGVMYFQGVPCQNGHDGIRYVKSGYCVYCRCEKNRAARHGAPTAGTYVLLADWRVVTP